MKPLGTIQGRAIGAAELTGIRRLPAMHRDWYRSRLSVELCR